MASTPKTAQSPNSSPAKTNSSSPSPNSSPPSPPPPPQESPPSPPPKTSESPPPPPSSNNSSPTSPPPPSKSSSKGSPSDSLTPPPPSKSSEKSSPARTSSNSKSDDSHEPSLNTPLVAGIIAGIVLFFILMIIACVCCSKRKKKKRHNPMQYYADPSVRKGSNTDYYTSGPPPKWGHPPMDHAVKVLPPPGGGWNAPPPPPMMISSGEMSVGFSGPHGTPLPPPSPTIALGFNKSTFTYEELVVATNNFSPSHLLGQGGFGYVHKGVLPNGKEIAVKQLKSGSGQGEREFQAEVDIISRVHHRHLVSLVGYCIAGSHRILVYEFVANKTLEHHLHGKGLPPMDWPTRLKIALGAAKGLAYLHEDCHPRIIHRDIKSSNILLDFKFEAMVADFGLAKLSLDNHTHVSTRVMGTFGYLAPEYASSGKLTEKSDVFSYGVMLLELITGRRPCDSSHTFMEDSLVDWARPVLSHALSDGNYDDLVDPRLEGNYEPMEMARMVACAAASVRHSARRRPKMSQIVRALDGDVSLEDLNEGMRPGQSMMFSSGSDYDSDLYSSNMRRIRKVALVSPEYSGEYSGPIGEYGHHSSSSEGFSGELNPIGNQRHRAHPQL